MHEGFFFGPPDRQLFGSYHPPTGASDLDLVVICPPFFSEYMRTYAALRELAVVLAEKGHPVLRFDYRGTGDSAGELVDVALADWTADVSSAIDEGRELSGARAARLVGVRAGAICAVNAARTRKDITRIVLWDPIRSGPAWMEGVAATQRDLIHRHGRRGANVSPEATVTAYATYRFSPRMTVDLEAVRDDIWTAGQPAPRVLVTREGAWPEGGSVVLERYACNWETDAEDIMVPNVVLERLVELVGGR